MTTGELREFWYAVRECGFESKNMLTNREIDRLVRALEDARNYALADKVAKMDRAYIVDLIQR